MEQQDGRLRRQVSRLSRVGIMNSSVIAHPERIKNMHMEILKVTIRNICILLKIEEICKIPQVKISTMKEKDSS